MANTMAYRRVAKYHCRFMYQFCSQHLKLKKISNYNRVLNRGLHDQKSTLNSCQFGFLFDIDGVIVRGRKLLPSARQAFRLLTDKNGNFRVPVVFVTNAGNALRNKKAQQLSEWLQVHVTEDQVVMSHSPLKMFQQFHDKHALINGQGPIKEIAHNVGFRHVTTVSELNERFPNLDKMDHQRRISAPCAFEEYFPRIETVILFGEPVRWETPLQLIVDVLLTSGKPSKPLLEIPYPHIPVLACNMDLLWMSEANMPRLGHGSFMNALESVYQKVTGKELKYTALIGKPSEITYHHADYILSQQKKDLQVDHIKTIYCIGDNPETDIYGGNLYNRYLQRRRLNQAANEIQTSRKVRKALNADFLDDESDDEDIDDEILFQGNYNESLEINPFHEEDVDKAYSCESILVCTGVFNRNSDIYSNSRLSNHNHRDFVIDPSLTKPTHVVSNVLEAVKLVFEKENFS